MTSAQGSVLSMKETQSVVEDAVSSVKKVLEIKRPSLSVDSTEGILNAIMKTHAHLSADETQPEMNARGTKTFPDVMCSQWNVSRNVKQPLVGENVQMNVTRITVLEHAAQPAPPFASSLQGKSKHTRTPL